MKHKFNRRMGYRIVDKYLFLHGVGMHVETLDSKGMSRLKINKMSRLHDRLKHPAVMAIRESLQSFSAAVCTEMDIT